MARDPEGYLGFCWEQEKYFKQKALGINKYPGQRSEGL